MSLANPSISSAQIPASASGKNYDPPNPLSCRRGNTDPAMILCNRCERFVSDTEEPTPLHWLIMFDLEEAAKVVSALVLGPSGYSTRPCKKVIDAVPPAESGIFFFPEHCAELFGTPLHWAVRVQNIRLVELLTNLGANINVCWSGYNRFDSGVSAPSLPNTSLLDFAVAFHLPEIDEILPDNGAERTLRGGGPLKRFIVLSIVLAWPALRYHDTSSMVQTTEMLLKKVIRLLVRRSFAIAETDSNGYNPLMIALRDADCDPYIFKELISAGASLKRLTLDASNAAITAINTVATRRNIVSSLAYIAPRVDSVNGKDKCGKTIQYATIGGSEAITEIISKCPGFEVNAKASNGHSALYFAAVFGSAEVLPMLIRYGAKVELGDSDGMTLLQLAIFYREKKAADILLGMGAEIVFPVGTPLSQGTALHATVSGASSSETVLRYLLTKHPKFRATAVINGPDMNGWTTLHKAAYYGDHDGIEALLEYGADRTLRDASKGRKPGRTPLGRVSEPLKIEY